jgi:protein tyrosine/serine phosphatase
MCRGGNDTQVTTPQADVAQVLNATFERKVITEAAEAGEPLLFFCKIGKDRTGVLAALLLSCCGAKPEEIIADYHRCSSSSLW